ncbi:MAG: restriction endonuclease subunit S [Acidobacteriota bacterium]|nr:restriction endonuclease subunit S [Acidobacteriota bacterium]
MGSEWREAPLDDLASEITVGHVGRMASRYVEAGIPFLRSLNVEPFRINLGDLKFIPPEFHSDLGKSSLVPGDVVVVRTGKPGACAVIPKSLPVANCSDLVIIRCAENLDPQFLCGYINSVASHHVRASLVGAVQQHFNVGAARRMIIRFPPLRDQRAIAHILGTLHEKIELNRRISETLEAMARALFKSWFIDFDPVRAKSEGRGSGLPAEVADLFPESFEESELGELPKHWSVSRIENIAQVSGGSTPSTKIPRFWKETGHLWATPKDLSGLSAPVLFDTARRISDEGLSQIGSGLLPKGTVLLSSRAPIGYLAIAENPTAVNQGFIAMEPKGAVSNLFLLFWARAAKATIISRANGSTFLEISKRNFRSMPIVLPPAEIMDAFDRRVRSLYGRIVLCCRESVALNELHDSLLHKIFTGDLQVL